MALKKYTQHIHIKYNESYTVPTKNKPFEDSLFEQVDNTKYLVLVVDQKLNLQKFRPPRDLQLGFR